MAIRTAGSSKPQQQRIEPYFKRLEPAVELEYSHGRDRTAEVRVFDDRDETGQFKLQFRQLRGQGPMKVAVFTFYDEDELAEFCDDMVAVRDALV